MGIKTKFNVGNNVWYIKYVTTASECPHCGEMVEEEHPSCVAIAAVDEVHVEISEAGVKEWYKLRIPFVKGKFLYTDRPADGLFKTQKEAAARFKELELLENEKS